MDTVSLMILGLMIIAGAVSGLLLTLRLRRIRLDRIRTRNRAQFLEF